MKTRLIHLSEDHDRRASGRSVNHVEQYYRTTQIRGSGGSAWEPAVAPSFREISHSFSRRERFQYWAAETAAFLVIGLTAGASLYVLAMTTAHFLGVQ